MYDDQNSVNSMAFPFMRKWLEDVWAIYHTRIYLLNQNGIQECAILNFIMSFYDLPLITV